MNEWVGKCILCGKDVYCVGGFLNGITLDKGSIVCFDCYEKEQEEHLNNNG